MQMKAYGVACLLTLAVVAFPVYADPVERPGEFLLVQTMNAAVEGGCVQFANEGNQTAFLAKMRSTADLAERNPAAARERIENDLLPRAGLLVTKGAHLVRSLLEAALSALGAEGEEVLIFDTINLPDVVRRVCGGGVDPDLIAIPMDTIHINPGCSDYHSSSCVRIHLAACSRIAIPGVSIERGVRF